MSHIIKLLCIQVCSMCVCALSLQCMTHTNANVKLLLADRKKPPKLVQTNLLGNLIRLSRNRIIFLSFEYCFYFSFCFRNRKKQEKTFQSISNLILYLNNILIEIIFCH